jgi:hypothetical protein
MAYSRHASDKADTAKPGRKLLHCVFKPTPLPWSHTMLTLLSARPDLMGVVLGFLKIHTSHSNCNNKRTNPSDIRCTKYGIQLQVKPRHPQPVTMGIHHDHRSRPPPHPRPPAPFLAFLLKGTVDPTTWQPPAARSSASLLLAPHMLRCSMSSPQI